MSKRIILLLDGTWNDADSGPADTNIVRLREIISRCMAVDKVAALSPQKEANRTSIASGRFESRDHLVFYERGVGTGGFLDLYFGGAFGTGLSRNIRRAYRFLAENYADGDEIFIFGFSRGSYTARSLAGYIAAAGLLYSNFCSEENESRAWYFYRNRPADRIRASLEKFPARRVQINCLGVFDTVGALGVPLPLFWKENRDLYEFHDVALSNTTCLNLHALAIDEHRVSFEAAPWRQPKFTPLADEAHDNVHQVWFAGAHSDVGGGYIDGDLRQRRTVPALDDITLDWMLKKVVETYDDFPVWRYETEDVGKQVSNETTKNVTSTRRTAVVRKPAWPEIGDAAAFAPQHEPRRGFYRALPFALRSVNNVSVPVRWRETNVGRDRLAATIGECIHESVLRRCGTLVSIGGHMRRYAPTNLVAALKEIATSDSPDRRVGVVDASGKRLDHEASGAMIRDAIERLGNLGIMKKH